MNFIHNHLLDGAQDFPGFGCGQHQVKRLRSGDEHIRRIAEHGGSGALGGVSRPHPYGESRPIRLLPFRHR
ncbi:hypothetical protein D3C75_563590 [compost metagenome]